MLLYTLLLTLFVSLISLILLAIGKVILVPFTFIGLLMFDSREVELMVLFEDSLTVMLLYDSFLDTFYIGKFIV